MVAIWHGVFDSSPRPKPAMKLIAALMSAAIMIRAVIVIVCVWDLSPHEKSYSLTSAQRCILSRTH
jgi:hypothetical protein